MNKARQIKLLMDCAHIFASKRVCNTDSFMHWWKIVKFAHFHGFLLTGFDEFGEIDMACIVYKVKDANDTTGDVLPELEQGNVLYVLAAASHAENPLKLFRLMKWCLRENPNVTKLAYHQRNSDNLIIHNLKGVCHGQELKT